ncbi:MAG TPA: hypothetical protein DF383_08995, partial [Deltaproteobacteria bacterium]|nr:hypothetical protein [Deltaproteobacteria bacterium]
GMKIRGQLSDSPGLAFEGEISFIGAEIKPDNESVEVRARIDNPNDEFKVGMRGSAEIMREKKAAALRGPSQG